MPRRGPALSTRSAPRRVAGLRRALARSLAGLACIALALPATHAQDVPTDEAGAPADLGPSAPDASGAPEVPEAPDEATDAASVDPAAAADAPVVDAIARELFVRACAACHGEDGSGTGPTVLDRPARDFRSGGFSFGNTPDALLRTITWGIPGTPMPAFGEAYTEDERARLADYVRSLGPPVEELDASDRMLVVTDRPRIVRGILPPVADGVPLRPRGMLIGTPQGLTFEYRTDDLRLLAVRQGDFVERTDWVGRGGTPLLPLGAPVLLYDGGDPGPSFLRLVDGAGDAQPLMSRALTAKEADASVELLSTLRWLVRDAATVAETVRAVTGPTGVAWEREIVLRENLAEAWTLVMPLRPLGPDAPAGASDGGEQPSRVASVLADGRVVCLQLAVGPGDAAPAPVPWRVERGPDGARLLLDLTPNRSVRLVVRTLLLPGWSAATEAALALWEPLR